MIRLARNQLPVPKILRSPALLIERRKAEGFYGIPAAERGQRRFQWEPTISLLAKVKIPLSKLSYGKCAYCEQVIAGLPNLEHFRPIRGAIAHEGEFSPDHYWWLAFEWENLLPSCVQCNVAKGKRFPTKGPRAAVGSVGEALAREEALLLDPTVDNPEVHLLFTETGQVVSRTERGEATIEVLALNRESLVSERLARLERLRSAFVSLAATENKNALEQLKRSTVSLKAFFSPESPHLGVTRQFAHLWAEEFSLKSVLPRVVKSVDAHAEWAMQNASMSSKAEVETTQQRFEQRSRRKERHSVEAENAEANSAYFGGVRRIERIVVHNFKAIRHLELEVSAPSADQESWLMLVGENSVGKSSLLQAVALALMGEDHVSRMALDARQFVSHEGDSDEGFVRIHLTNVTQPVELRFNRRERHFSVTPPESLVLLLGYGATRLLPRAMTRNERRSRYIRVRNLFNPYARLSPTERILTDRAKIDGNQFDQVAWALKQLLLLGDHDTVTRKRRRVVVQTPGFRASLMELSDGYQSVVALAGDIMTGVGLKWKSIESAEGVVLIDEIEAHLHPLWKMKIVSQLRRVFPRLTFIVTTHDPLCLRGLFPGEIVVFRRRDKDILAETVREPLDHLRADQLLTSPLFGLAYTRAESVERAIARCSELLGKAARTAAEEFELRELQDWLSVALQASETPGRRSLERAVEKTLANTAPEQLWGPLPDPSSITVPTELRGALNERLESLKAGLETKL
jgi:uncharacterized protein (TIGR02646 family)